MRLVTIGCWGAYPGPGAATSGYLLQAEVGHGGKRNVLLDCGSGVLSLLQRELALERLDAVVLSHFHADHVADLGCLHYAMLVLTQLGKRSRPLDIYAHAEDPEAFARIGYEPYCKAHAIAAGNPLEIGGLTFRFANTAHTVPCLAMRIEEGGRSLVYTADTAWSEDVVRLAGGADLLLTECNLYNDQLGQVPGHLTAGEAGRLAAVANAKRLVLTHLPHYGDHGQLVREAEREFAGPVRLVQAGDRYEI